MKSLNLNENGVSLEHHKCDENGSYFLLGNDQVIYEKHVRCPTNEETHKYVERIAEEQNTWICGGGVCCSICGAIPNYFV